jgi:hypothetical protein
VSIDEQHVALPKLYGAPAYARPPKLAPVTERPFDPDELPLEAFRTEEEREFVDLLPARAFAPGGAAVGRNGHGDHGHGPSLRPRPFSLRSITGKIRGS